MRNSTATAPKWKALAEIEAERRRRRRITPAAPDPADPPAPPTFREFVSRVAPRYRWYRHCEVLADVLQRVADGELKRVLVFMPPRHGKSETISRLFPAYYLLRYPERWVGINSYAADLAYTLSRAARENYGRAGAAVRDDAWAVKHWQTTEGGGLWAAGVGGPITGKGFHCLSPFTPIDTPDGRIPIGEIVRAGRPVPVYSFNHATGRVEVRVARKFSERWTDEPIVRVRIGPTTLEMTPEHPVYVVGKGYIPAIQVKAGDRVLCRQPGSMSATTAVPSIVASRASRLARRAVSAPIAAISTIARRIARRSAANNAASISSRLPRISGASIAISAPASASASGNGARTIRPGAGPSATTAAAR